MALRSGNEYLAGLQGPREVWLNDERVEDVTKHPALAPTADTIAGLYDQQGDPDLEGTMSRPSGVAGERVPISLLPPASREDLAQRGRACGIVADETFGLLGRTPDFGNILIASFAASSEFFAAADQSWAENVRSFHRHCLATDTFVVHASINPQTDRSKASSQQGDPFLHLRVVREQPDGLVVRGAKMVATLAPLADELLVFPLPRLQPGDEPYALAFAIPIATPGLRLLCREPALGHRREPFDYPLSTNFDEIDATCVFDDVVVPWDRVFLYGQVEMANTLFDATRARPQTGHQGLVRSVSKAGLMAGVAIELADMSGASSFLHVQDMLGELLAYRELLAGVLCSAEAHAESVNGLFSPAMEPILSARCQFPHMYRRMVEIIQTIGGATLLTAPAKAALEGPHGADVDRYFQGRGNTTTEARAALLRLAWDLVGTDFGQRQMQFERYHAGDPVRLSASLYADRDWAPLRRVAERALRLSSVGGPSDGA